MFFYLFVLFLTAVFCPNVFSQNEYNTLPPSCNSKIYCESELLHDVQLAKLYPDSKTFVDMKLKYSEDEILSKYKTLKDGLNLNGHSVPKQMLQTFVNNNLEEGDELEKWIPPDFTTNPSLATRVTDQNYKKWVFDLNEIWHTLARKMKDDVRIHPEKYSLIWVPNGLFIPGGRFKEVYYWDTYWIINGLLLCDMRDTVRGVILNIVSLVRQYHFMLNGSRKYYENRSQPPMLIPMVVSYYKATNDFGFVQSVIDALEIEFNFWMKNRMVTFQKNGVKHMMAIYNVKSRGPRPESYREDYEAAEKFDTEEKKNEFYSKIKSGAETGWDFTSRFFVTPSGTNRGALPDIQTPSIVPVDLNSLLHANAEVLSIWFGKLGDVEKSNKFKNIAKNFLMSIQEVMWSEEKGCWFDWDLINNKPRDYFYVSNIVPLWTGSYCMPKTTVAKKVLRYLKDLYIIEEDDSIRYQGTPTSLFVSGNQWDLPNGWSPLQAFIIQGLDRTGEEEAQIVARNLADVWLRTNYKGFAEKGVMFEKMDVFAEGETGGGGEYHPQTGFGWTNGFILELLDRYGDSTTYKRAPPTEKRFQDNNNLINYNNRNVGDCCLEKFLDALNFLVNKIEILSFRANIIKKTIFSSSFSS